MAQSINTKLKCNYGSTFNNKMMKRELRIGNLVTDEFFDSFSKIIEVDSIGEKGINLTPSDDGKPYGLASSLIDHDYSFDQLRGIPLTTEWLLKAGFEKHETILITSYEKKLPVAGIKVLSVHIQPNNQYMYLKEMLHDSNINTDLVTVRNSDVHGEFYLHQLQNLYFALTGEELLISN